MKSNMGSGHILWALKRQQEDPLTPFWNSEQVCIFYHAIEPSSLKKTENNIITNPKFKNIRVMPLTKVTQFMHKDVWKLRL